MKRSTRKLDIDSLEAMAKMINEPHGDSNEASKPASRASASLNQSSTNWRDKFAGMTYKEKMILSKM